MRYRYKIAFGSSMALAVIFLTAAVGKLLGQSAFLLALTSTYVINAHLSALLASVLPWLELAVGLFLLVGIIPQIAAGVAILLSAAFILHNSWMVLHGFGYVPCSCLGVFDIIFGGELATITSLYIDIGMVVVALAVYFLYPGRLLNVRPWFFRWREIVESPPKD
jgi:uncharacterized membrane protein YphA (DoxX/SURF4 family)